mmetsp:Transcript_25187/g.38087  ORF Transcript_25187/g.38087 Transcript_25187/m.38087 type:complete len:112 (-) Transcript_25187:100-435(-)
MFKVSADGFKLFPCTNLQLDVFFFEKVMSSLGMQRPFMLTCTFPFGVGIADDELFVCADIDEDVLSEIKSSSPLSLTSLEEDFLLTNELKRFVVFENEFFLDFANEEGKLT